MNYYDDKDREPGKLFFWLFPIAVILLSLFVVIGKCNAQSYSYKIDSIANNLPFIKDTLVFDDSKLIDLYLEMEELVNLNTWKAIDIERAYYARLDFIDLLKELNSNYYNLTNNHFIVIIRCSIFEGDLFERLNHLKE